MASQFETMYSGCGPPSVPPRRPLNAQLLIAIYSSHSDLPVLRAAAAVQLAFFRWFLDLELDERCLMPALFRTVASA
jgi:hypothetical protein